MSETPFHNDPEFDPELLAELRRIKTTIPGVIRLFHATTPLAAESILAEPKKPRGSHRLSRGNP